MSTQTKATDGSCGEEEAAIWGGTVGQLASSGRTESLSELYNFTFPMIYANKKRLLLLLKKLCHCV